MSFITVVTKTLAPIAIVLRYDGSSQDRKKNHKLLPFILLSLLLPSITACQHIQIAPNPIPVLGVNADNGDADIVSSHN